MVRRGGVRVGPGGTGGAGPATREAPPVAGPPERIAAHLRELADAGADEAILVADPIDERSIRELAEAVALAG